MAAGCAPSIAAVVQDGGSAVGSEWGAGGNINICSWGVVFTDGVMDKAA
jgi:hypothetical protein